MNKPVFIIAEAGINHNGNIDLAYQLIDAAVTAGADVVKFQTFKAEKVISRFAQKAEYQKATTAGDECQLDMAKKLELDEGAFLKLFNYCKDRNIMFLSTPFDHESINLLCRLELPIMKIPSGEITNLPYLRKMGALKKKIIMSTGMSNLKEIENALNVLTDCGTEKTDITVLHCNTEYPTPYCDVNLMAMQTIKAKLNVKVGYSDHTLGIEVPVAAVALGAEVIEKHFTLDRNMAGPDHSASLEPEQLKAMVSEIRNVEASLGDGIKRPSPSELKNMSIARRSIIASRDIKKGEILSTENIIAKRPGNGISPMKWDEVIGKKAQKDFRIDQLIEI